MGSVRRVRLKEVAMCRTGVVLRRYAGDTRYKLVTAEGIDEYGRITDTEIFYGAADMDKFLIRCGDVLMPNLVPNNAVCIEAEYDGALAGSNYYIIRPVSPDIDPRFLAVYLSSHLFRRDAGIECGENERRVKIDMSTLKEAIIPVLEKAEQERIIKLSREMILADEEAMKQMKETEKKLDSFFPLNEQGHEVEAEFGSEEAEVRDHHGVAYASVEEMCRRYKIPVNTFTTKRLMGVGLKEALETPKDIWRDHLGNEYPSQRAMLAEYGVVRRTFRWRLKEGWTLRQALLNEPPVTKE